MKKAILIILFFAAFSCKKTGADNNGSVVSYTLNGKSYSNVNVSAINLFYKNRQLTEQRIALYIYNPNFGFDIDCNNAFLSNAIAKGDTLGNINMKIYYSDYSSIMNDSVGAQLNSYGNQKEFSLVPVNFKIAITITSLSNNVANGNFSGIVTARNSNSNIITTDTITNGSFSNVPVRRNFY